MAKVPDPVGSLDPRAQALYDHLIAKRGRIDGMYRSLLNHPEFAQRIGELGSYLRFGDSVLPDEVRELAILRTARRLGAAYEWVKHVVRGGQALARHASVPDENAREGQRRSPDDGHRPEHKAATRLRRGRAEEVGASSGTAATGQTITRPCSPHVQGSSPKRSG